MKKPNYVTFDDALAILEGRGIKISRQLLRHYCNSERAPLGTIHVGRSWVFTIEGLNMWTPVKRAAGRKKKLA